MVVLEDLKDLLMYKKQFFLPVNMKDKRHGSAIMLMTPNYQSSMLAMTEPYTLNRRTFESYYIEKQLQDIFNNRLNLLLKLLILVSIFLKLN